MSKLSVALGAAVVTATLLTRAAVADEPATSGAATAASCVSGDAATALVPGEIVSPRELDARVGWLTLTTIDDARTALEDNRGGEATRLLAQAKDLLRASKSCARQAGDETSTADRAEATLTSAEAALANGDREAAVRQVTEAAQTLQPWVIGLDAVLFPGAIGRR
jgi:hypothetical protein